nr:MAG TPA: hypothetical protein [Bacteriophage sp.]
MHIIFVIALVLIYPFLASFLSFFRVLELLPSCIYRVTELLVILFDSIDNIKQCRVIFLCSRLVILYSFIYYGVNVISSFLGILCCII